jgi:tRNA(Phe) wybutosine-synthesizing methylase Tyw3
MKAGHTEWEMEMWEDILKRKKELLLEQSFILHCNANNVMFQFTIY